jgi:hypothetical protein
MLSHDGDETVPVGEPATGKLGSFGKEALHLGFRRGHDEKSGGGGAFC